MVELSGEAYFEVRSQKSRPFKIITPNSEIEVKGTAFNLKDYPSDPVAIVEVTEGQVAFKDKLGEKQLLLNANDQGKYDPDQAEVLAQRFVRNLNARSWMTESIQFWDTPITEIIQDLETYFQVEINHEELKKLDCNYTARFKNNESIDQILNNLKSGLNLEVTKIGDQAYQLSGGNCRSK